MKLVRISSVLIGVALLSSSAVAGPVGLRGVAPSQQNMSEEKTYPTIGALLDRREGLVEQASMTRGRHFQEIYGQRLTNLDDLITRLNAGESVSPEEIDRAMQK